MTNCTLCGRKLDQPDDPASDDCGGDCWACIEEIEAWGAAAPDDGYRQATEAEKAYLRDETKRIHAEFRAHREAKATAKALSADCIAFMVKNADLFPTAAQRFKARVIAMTEPEWSAYLDECKLHRSFTEPWKQWRRDAKAAARKARNSRITTSD